MDDREERREDERRERDRLFEANKRMTTLSATALALVFGASRFGAEGVPVVAGVAIFGFSLLCALMGFHDATLQERMPRWWQLYESGLFRALFLFTLMAFTAGAFWVLIWPVID